MSKHRTRSRLSCTVSILLEKPEDIAFASELVAAIRIQLDKNGGRPC